MFDIKQARKICAESKIAKLCNNNGELTFSGHLFIEKALKDWPEALDEIERMQTDKLKSKEKYDLVNNLLFGDMTVSFAAIDVIKERQRQVEQEKFSAERDDKYTDDELAKAAAVYALPENVRHYLVKYTIGIFAPKIIADNLKNLLWPWAGKWWKPTPLDRRRELIKAAALIVAEIERLDRRKSEGTK